MMEYAIPTVIFAIFFCCHYALVRLTRRAMDPENRGYDIPFPLWFHFIIAIPSGLVTAFVAFLLLKAFT